MKVTDLGQLDAPVLLFGGPYSNMQATRALLREAEAQGISADHVICTGDVVAYCAHPAETVAVMRDFGCPVVAGNCERQLAAYKNSCGCGFEAGTTCDLLSAGWYAHANGHVEGEPRRWMAGLPDLILFTHQGLRCAVIHGGATDVSRFVWSVSEREVFREEISEIQKVAPDISCIIAGHSGIAFQRAVDGIRWINAGVIGMPAHHGHPDTQFAVLQNGTVHFHALSYDHAGAASAMCEAGLTQGYHRALTTGYWPSEDVLPLDLRASSRASG